jgi:hypothetical protein
MLVPFTFSCLGTTYTEPYIKYIYIYIYLKKKVAQAGKRTRDLFISFIFSFHHLTAEPQRLPRILYILNIAIYFIRCAASR